MSLSERFFFFAATRATAACSSAKFFCLRTAAGIRVELRENFRSSAGGARVLFFRRIEEQDEDVVGERRPTS